MNHDTPANTLKKELEDMIGQNQVKEVFVSLRLVFEYGNPENRQTLIMKERDWKEIIKHEQEGTQSSEEIRLVKNRTIKVLLALIKDITETEAIRYNVQYTVFEKILIVCRKEDNIANMKKLFPEIFYKILRSSLNLNLRKLCMKRDRQKRPSVY